MDEDSHDYHEMLETKRFEIVQHLQIDRTFVFDYLRHNGVLDCEDIELIQSEKTTPQKIGKFVDVLARKGPQAYQYLLESLQLEHPVLYEKLTGKQADATTSPIMAKLKKSFSGIGDPLGNSELEILTHHLERTYGDLHEMSRRFEQVVQHKKNVEEQLETTTSDLERHKEKLDFLEKKIDSEKSSSMPTSPSNNFNWVRCAQYIDNMRKELSDRDIYIIALQTNVMSAREEIECLKKRNDNMLLKNDELQKMVEEMNESYQKKKCESLRLSERIERQGNEIKKAEQTMRKYRSLQFHNMQLREERDHFQEELEELRKWTEALKTRYDIVEYEKEKTLSDHTEIMADYGSLQAELIRCREEMNEVQLVAADLRERVRHLEHDRQTYKRQRDGALTARREAILDRDKAFLERDQSVKKYNELKSGNDAAIEKQILQLKSYDEVVARSDVMEEEVKQVKINLRQTERELEELKLKHCVPEEDEKSEDDEKETPECKTDVPAIEIVGTDGEIAENEPRKSSTHSIVKSIKRRVGPPSPAIHSYEPPIFPDFPLQSPEYPANSLKFAAFPSKVCANFFKEGTLQRNRITRMPIKVRQNSKDETTTDCEEKARDASPGSSVGGEQRETICEEKDTTLSRQDGVSENENIETSSGSKLISYL